MLTNDLFNTDYERRLNEGAVDQLEQRRIDDLNMKMDELANRVKTTADKAHRESLLKAFLKCKEERDSYYKIKETAGGIGQDLVTPQQRVQQSTPQKQTPIQKVGSTVKHAANWLAGKGGPGKEGPTYEEAELDEQEAGPFDVVAGKNLVLLQQAWEKQLPNVSLEFPGQNVTVYLPQVYSIFAHLQKMNNNKQVATVQKFFGNRQDFLMWMNSIKQLQIPPKVQKSVKSNFAQPEPGQLDLGIAEAKKKDSLTTPGDPESEVAIKLARSRHPTAKSDLSALVKDKIATDKTVKKEIDQVKADNERQEKEIQSLEKETDALSIATSNSNKPKNFDINRDPTTPLPPSAGAFVPVPTVSTTPAATATIPAGLPPPEPTTAKAADVATEPTIGKAPTVTKDIAPVVSKGKEVKDKADTRTMNYRPVTPRQVGRPQTPALPGVQQKQAKDMGSVNIVPQVAAPGLGSAGDAAQLAQVSSRGNRQQRFAKPKTVSVIPGNFGIVDESQMSELDAMRQDLELMSERQFYVAYGMSKAAFQQKYRTVLKPADPRYAKENVDNDDWDEDEGDFVNDPTVHARVRKQPLPDQVLRAIERNPAMRADIIAAYKRKQGIAEGNVNPKFIIAQVTRLLATEARRMTNAPMAQLLAPVMQEYGLSLQQIDAMIPGGLRKAAGEYGIMMKEGSWGGSGPAGLKTPYAVYTKQNGQVKRVKTTNKIGKPMNTREAEAYVAAMRKRDPARWTHDTVWVGPADHDLDEGDQIRLGDVQPGTSGYDAWYKSTHKTTPPGEKPQPAGKSDYDWTEKQKIMPKVLPEAGDRVDPILYKALDRMQPGIAGQGQPGDDLFSAARTALATEWGLSALRSEYATATAYTRQLIDLYLAKHGIKEAQTDYQKRRQRERDVDAGRPVARQRQPKQTDYQKRRAQDRKDMELGEMDKSQKSPAGWNLDDYDYSKGKWTQGKIMTAKDAVKSASKEFDSVFNKPNPKDKKKSVEEEKTRLDPKCWSGKKIGNPKTKVKGGVRVNNCVPAESIDESYTGVMQSQGITDARLLEVARKIDLFAKTVK